MNETAHAKAMKLIEEAKNKTDFKDLLRNQEINSFVKPLEDKYDPDDSFYRLVTTKDYLTDYKDYFYKDYEKYLQMSPPNKNYFKNPLDALEKTLALYSIALHKVIDLQNRDEYQCTIEELKSFLLIRLDMEKKVNNLRSTFIMMD